jgi:chromosome partitioning protein
VPVIAVINRKGGSGKSTVATHLAAHFAREGASVMLGDVDRQQSSRAWLKRRTRHEASVVPQIQGWVVDKVSVARPPGGTTHLILDTPGGLTGFDLAKLVMWCDAVLIPVCDSAFDRESAAACHAELQALPRVSGGRCQVGVLGMRIDSRTRGDETMQAWAAERGMHWLGALRAAQVYVQSAERGLTVFDLPAAKASADLEQWQPVLAWLHEVMAAVPKISAAAPPAAARPPRRATRPNLPPPPVADSDLAAALTLTGVARPGWWGWLKRWMRA